MKLKPYLEYKDSGVPWLGKVPKEWVEKRAKYLFREIDIRSTAGEEELLSVSHITGVTPRSKKNVTMFKSESYEGSKLCYPDDLVINTMWAWMAALGVSKYKGIVSPSYHVYRLRHKDSLVSEYIDKLLRSWGYAVEYRIRSTGIRPSRLRLYPDKFLTIPICIPSLREQKQIIKYIKFKSSQIARFIRAKKRMIELLKEQKQAIINDAVTGKIDVRTGKPYPKYKPSGVEWLGDVPCDWDIYPLKRCIKSNIDSLSEKTSSGYEFEYIEINKVKSGYMIGAPAKINFGNSPSRARRKVKRGDTIISTVRTYLRSVLFIDFEKCDNLIVSTGFSVLSPNNEINPRYLGYLLRSDNFIDRVIQNSIGVSYPAIADSRLISLKIILPSTYNQSSIVNYIEKETKNIDLAISRTEREINLMQEYRTRLISDVVTGKVDVREIHVPEVAEEDLIIEDITETEALDETGDEEEDR
ncbi:MAG: restriction endonuclease subunit S [Candidatus Scalindua sp.]|nr:restriction endonuclease subunit S [Candidatus Scalindua sp.]